MSFTADDLRAFLRALAQDPEARAQLAGMLVEHYLRELRDEIHALAEAQRRTEERVAKVEEQLAALAEAQRRTEESLRQLAETVTRLAHDVERLKGMSLETHYLLHADGLFGALARGIRVLDGPAKEALLGPAIEAGKLTLDEAIDIRRADVLAVGRRDGVDVYLVVEVSWAIDQGDIERARTRAALLERAGVRALPVVAGQVIHPAIDEVARASGVWRVLDGSVSAPAA
ncbi:MAG TPA: hypothetical protein VNO34_09005 [Actinomycetota bacterium]|nr:hypothetical protein [Actinomycetota bacterium]